jgi:hypothetical protein
MKDSFDAETLRLLDETDMVYIETRRDTSSPMHRTIIWVVVVGGEAFVRSVRGPKGRWYREISSNPEVALHVRGNRIRVRAAPATDGTTVDAVSTAIRDKYGQDAPGPTAEMVRPDALPTTVKLSLA